ncbi:MAG TPA: hypothetical protein VGM82_08405 [Gemmatimonadaceae bacterium]|jgi:hypothetical protein
MTMLASPIATHDSAGRAGCSLTPLLGNRLKRRLEKAVLQAVVRPSRATPALRHVIADSLALLRLQSFDDDRISTVLKLMIEDVARSQHLNARSLLTGDPRWFALRDRVDEWIACARPGTVSA